MSEPTCATCKFRRQSNRQYARDECRRRSPIMVKHQSSCATFMAPGWPDINPTDWCGDFEQSIDAPALDKRQR